MKKYQIIYADPPWKYDNEMNGDPKMGGKTYPTMTLEEIKALKVADIADKDCALFLWATMPKLREALEVIDAWGFKYITCAFVWVKQNKNGEGIYSGLGHWTNGNAELCLFAKKGHPKRSEKNVKQIVLSPLRGHSQKPEEVKKRIHHLLGTFNKEGKLMERIELFAREKTDWFGDVWGNDIKDEKGNKVESDIKLYPPQLSLIGGDKVKKYGNKSRFL